MILDKKLLLIGLSTLLLTACAKEEGAKKETLEADELKTEEVSTESLIEEAKNNTSVDTPIEIEFSRGVEEGIAIADSENYMDIEGYAKGATQVNVIYEGIVIDVLPVDSDGFFSYYSKGSDEITTITFATDAGATYGDAYPTGEAENAIGILFLPTEENDGVFAIGETVYFENGQEVTITHVGLTDERPNGEIKNNFVRVDFTIDNQTSGPLEFNSHLLELYDGERNKAEINAKDFYGETIAAGMKGNGSAYFDSIAEGPFTIILGAATWESE